MQVTRETIVAQARGWLGTPFHHQGRLKGVGCDCLGLIVGVAAELQLTNAQGVPLASFDQANYSPLPSGMGLKSAISAHLRELPAIGEALPGDIPLIRFDDDPQHVGILSVLPDGADALIHCYANAGRVVEHRLNDTWRRLIVGIYRFPTL